MATNPLYNTNDSPNNSTQPTKAVNNQGVSVKRTHNTFDNSYFHYKTQRFGQYEPFFVMDVVPDDMIPLSTSHDVRSLPMSSPFLSSLKLNKDFFMVPMQAILPNTWEYIYKQPAQGDDVPADAMCLFPAFSVDTDFNLIDYLFKTLQSASVSQDEDANLLSFWSLLTLEMLCSQGSLLAMLGYHMNPRISFQMNGLDFSEASFDIFFDNFMRNISVFSIEVETDHLGLTITYDRSKDESSKLYQILSICRRYGSQVTITDLSFDRFDIAYVEGLPSFSRIDDFGTDINLSRVLAYQLSCSQFYVNPQIDFLYNAQLYRDNVFNLMRNVMTASGSDLQIDFFTMNGIQVPYDYLSKNYFYNVLNEVCLGSGLDSGNVTAFYDFMYAVFGIRESLRFGDYFTDSRTRALAPGDDFSAVTGEGVSVIDVTRKIVFERFRNAVVKLSNNFGDYLRGIMGTSPSPDYHFPKFIAHQDFEISGFEVANQTDTSQGSLVTNLKTADDRYVFEVDVDMPAVILGISYFSVPRVYMQTKDRHFFHRDRFDMFNPMLQYIGDQIVYNHERTDLRPNDEIFGYQSRNNEYKQRLSVASGAFPTLLPAWSFIGDSLFDPLDDVEISNVQSPDFIRAHDYEFNRFFKQMPGYSLANAFHFIVVYNNKCMSNRPMEVNPNIL